MEKTAMTPAGCQYGVAFLYFSGEERGHMVSTTLQAVCLYKENAWTKGLILAMARRL